MSDLAQRLRGGDAAALAKAVSLVEAGGSDASALLRQIHSARGRAAVIGVTGPPGAGKSTLINGLVHVLRRRGNSIGIVAVDPTSPLSGGAVLGDRLRLTALRDDPEVFFRSLSSTGILGGLAPSVRGVIDVLDAAGKDLVLVETVGTGQSETAIAGLADVVVVVCPPGLGDGIQALKGGVLEVADILVVNKADLPAAASTIGQLQGMLALRGQATGSVPVLATIATGVAGISELAEAILAKSSIRPGATRRRLGAVDARRRLVEEILSQLQARMEDEAAVDLDALSVEVERGGMDLRTAARRLIDRNFKGRKR